MPPQNLATSEPPPHSPGAERSLLEEGARYALLQRLTPVLQHQIMGTFQSVSMITVMMERRLQSDSPNLENLRQDCGLLGSVSESAVKSIIELLTWVRPKPAATQRFDAGVQECASLLFNEFKLKGFVIANEVAQIDAQVSSQALRSVVSAALVTLGDLSTAPATLTLRAEAFPDRIDLSIALDPLDDQATKTVPAHGYRLLNWRDVELLAGAESVGLAHSDGGALLTFPLSPEK